jgi:uncharacterized membrane protein
MALEELAVAEAVKAVVVALTELAVLQAHLLMATVDCLVVAVVDALIAEVIVQLGLVAQFV